MKTNDLTTNGMQGEKRQNINSAQPTAGSITNVQQQDNGKVMMNKQVVDYRGSRADALIDIMNMDQERLTLEAPRHTKIPG